MTAPSPAAGRVVGHVLLDADGVLQRVDPGWAERARPYLGDRAQELLDAFWVRETPALVGRADVVDVLADALRHVGLDVPADELYPRIWLHTEVLPHAHDLVAGLRAAGLGVHLGTNQTALRAAHMRRTLGYDALFDVSVYSCEIGVAKPDPAYFERAVQLIGAPAAEVVFVDDSEANVEAARAVGLGGVHWRHTDGLAALEAALADAGVPSFTFDFRARGVHLGTSPWLSGSEDPWPEMTRS